MIIKRYFPLAQRVIILFSLLLTSTLLSQEIDVTDRIMVQIQYGHGDYFLENRNSTTYDNLILEIEKNFDKMGGFGLFLESGNEIENIYGACEGYSEPSTHIRETNTYFLSAYFFLNWEYFGFKAGLLGRFYDVQKAYCETKVFDNKLIPLVEAKFGLINRLYVVLRGPQSFMANDFSYGIKYHFKNYYSQIYIGKNLTDIEQPVILQGDLLLYKKFIVSSMIETSFTHKLKYFNLGLGYLF